MANGFSAVFEVEFESISSIQGKLDKLVKTMGSNTRIKLNFDSDDITNVLNDITKLSRQQIKILPNGEITTLQKFNTEIGKTISLKENLSKGTSSVLIDDNIDKKTKEKTKNITGMYKQMFDEIEKKQRDYTRLFEESNKKEQKMINEMANARERSEVKRRAEIAKSQQAQSDAINKALQQNKLEEQKMINEMANARERSEVKRRAEIAKSQQAQSDAINKALQQNKLEEQNAKEFIRLEQEKLKIKHKSIEISRKNLVDATQSKNISHSINNLSTTNIADAKSKVAQLNIELQKLDQNARMNGLQTGNKNLMSLSSGVKSIITKLGVFVSMGKTIRDSSEYVYYLNKAYTDLNITMDISKDQFIKMTNEIQKMGVAAGTSTKNIMDIARVYANASTTVGDVMKKIQPSMWLSNVARMNGGEVTKVLQGTINQFKLMKEEGADVSRVTERIGNSLVSISQNMAMDFGQGIQELVEGVKTSGSVAELSGQSLESYLALLGATAEQSGKTGSEIANAYKMISARILQQKQLAETEGITEDEMANAEKTLKKYNISIRENGGNLKNLDAILMQVSESWKTMNDSEKQYVANTLAGVRQSSTFISIIESMTRQQELYNNAIDNSNALQQAQEKYAGSLEGKLGSLSATYETLVSHVLNGSTLMAGVSVVTTSLEGITFVIDKIGLFPTIITGTVVAMTLFNSKFRETTQMMMGFSPALNNVFQKLGGLKTKFEVQSESIRAQITHIRNLTTEYQKAGLSTSGFGKSLSSLSMSLITTNIKLVAVKVASIALQTVLSAGLSLGIGLIISGLTQLVDKLIVTKEELKEMNDESTRFVQENSKSVAQTQKLFTEKIKLENAIANNDNIDKRTKLETELVEIEKQLASILPQSATAINEQGDAISTNNGLITEQIRLKKEQIEIEALGFIENNKNLSSELNSLDEKKKRYNDMKLAMIKGERYSRDITVTERGATYTKKYTQNVTNSDLDKLNKEIEDITLKASQAQTHIKWLLDNGYTSSQINAMGFKTDAVENYIKTINSSTDAIGENTKAKKENSNITIGEGGIDNLSIEEATKAYGDATKQAKELDSILQEVNKQQQMTPELIMELSDKYPELGAKITDVSQVQDFLNNKIKEQVVAQQEAYQEMIGNDETYYNSKIKNSSEAQDYFNKLASEFVNVNGENYQFDLGNFRTLNEAKAGFINQLSEPIAQFLSNLIGGNVEGYRRDLANTKTWAEAKATIMSKLDNEITKIENRMVQAFTNSATSADALGQEKFASKALQKIEQLTSAKANIDTSFDNFYASFNTSTPTFSSGSFNSGNSGSGGKGSSDQSKEVADYNIEIERYYKLNDVLDDYNNLLKENKLAQESTFDVAQRNRLKAEEIALMTKKKDALNNLNIEQKKELDEIANLLRSNDFLIDSYGNLTNSQERLQQITNSANGLSGTVKESAIDTVKKLESAVKRYTTLANQEIPKTTAEWKEMNNAIKNSATSMLEETRDKIANALRKQREEEKEFKVKELDKRIEELQKQIKALDDEEQDKVKKKAKLEAELNKWQGDDSVLAKKKIKELQSQIKNLEKEIKKDELQKQIDEVEKTKNDLNKVYEEQLSDKSIYGEANKLLSQENIEEITKLLQSYNEDFKNIGHLIGSSFSDAFQTEIQNAINSLKLLRGEMNTFNSSVSNSTSQPNTTPVTNTTPQGGASGGSIGGVGSRVKVSNLGSPIYYTASSSNGSGTWGGTGFVDSNTPLYIVNDVGGRVALAKENSINSAIGWIDKHNLARFNTGGFVGNWSSGEGRLGLLDDGEFVLTKEQTKAWLDLVPRLKELSEAPMLNIKNILKGEASGSVTNNNTINNEWNITNNDKMDILKTEKTMTEMVKEELRRFGKK